MSDYTDDRPGMMRVHIAHERAEAACKGHSRPQLNEHAKAHGLPTSHRLKRTLAWFMAQHGLIDAHGNLRDGFPGATA